MDLGEIADFDLELRGVNSRLGQVGREADVGRRTGQKGGARHVKFTLPAIPLYLLLQQNDAGDALAGRVVQILIGVDDDDAGRVT